jgi:hypothetical protein
MWTEVNLTTFKQGLWGKKKEDILGGMSSAPSPVEHLDAVSGAWTVFL